jgi:hypothetical protein
MVLREGDFFLCEKDVWTVVESTWKGGVVAENPLGLRRRFHEAHGHWEACRDSPRQDC